MSNRNHSLMSSIAACLLVFGQTGCAGDVAEEEEDVGSTRSALITENALSANALSANALSANALNPIKDPGAAGLLSRELLRYTVGCALSTTQSFSFSWTANSDVVHNETYMGALGLATAWAAGPLDLPGQRMVSACLAARTNYYRTPVVFSARSTIEPLKSSMTSDELTDYNRLEGAFWGNLFSATPYLNSCYRANTVDHSRTQLRECAAGHLSNNTVVECGMIHIAGACAGACAALDTATKTYPSCVDHAEIHGSTATTAYVITSDLQ